MRSSLLVIGQFACIAALLLCGGWLLPWWAWLLFAMGLFAFVLAVLALGGKNFTIMPEPRASNELSVHGIYRYVRHPMYAAVLLCGIAVAFGAPSLWRWVALPVCFMVLVLKIRHEERLLLLHHPDYEQRMKKVPRLLPFLW